MIDASADTDGDGLKDVVEGGNVNDGFDVNDENRDADSIALADTDGDLNGGDGTNAVPLNIDSDFREAIDTDGDNVNDADDIDDDNDGILDTTEFASFTPVPIDLTDINDPEDFFAAGIPVVVGSTVTGVQASGDADGNLTLSQNANLDGTSITLTFDSPTELILSGGASIAPADLWSISAPGATFTVSDGNGNLNAADGTVSSDLLNFSGSGSVSYTHLTLPTKA